MKLRLLAALLALGACAAPPDPSRKTALDPEQVCERLASLGVRAQRESFTLAFAEAERSLREAITLFDAHPEAEGCPGALSRSAVQAELGLALSGQRRFRLADAAFAASRASLQARQASTPAERERLELDRARLAAHQAQHALNRNDFVAAEAEGAALLAQIGAEERALDALALGDLFNVERGERDRRLAGLSGFYARSAALARDGAGADARAPLGQALDLAGSLPGSTGALRSRLETERALAELEAGRAQEAADIARRAAEQLERELPETPLAAQARLVQAVALAETGRRDEAFGAFEEAFTIYRENPVELRYERVWPFIRLTLAAMRDGSIPEQEAARRIFNAGQLVRSASAATDIAQTAALLEEGDGADAEAIRVWRDAQERLFRVSTALSRRDLDPLTEEALNQLFVEIADEEARLRARRDRVAPEFAAAVETPVTLAEAQAALRPGEALLQILVGAPRSTLLFVTPNDARVATSVLTDAGAAQATLILRSAMFQGADGRYPVFPAPVAAGLHDVLLGPFAEMVAAADRVFVATNGALQGLPLELLLRREAGEMARLAAGDYTSIAWLGDVTAFSYLPAARNLVDLRRAGASRAADDLLGFGDFRPGQDPLAALDPATRRNCSGEAAVVARLPALPGTAQELRAVAAAFEGESRVLTGSDFTESAVKRLAAQGALDDARVLHFATHGLLWPTPDCFDPALTTSLEAGSGEDGLLDSGEIRRLALDAQLVVLSACQSTDGEIAEAGENLSGLARSFFTAGSRSVIASHWLVDDQATASLMADLYGRLADDRGLAFDQALAAAQARLRSDPALSHPAFWAAFVTLGDGAQSLAGG